MQKRKITAIDYELGFEDSAGIHVPVDGIGDCTFYLTGKTLTLHWEDGGKSGWTEVSLYDLAHSMKRTAGIRQ